MKKLLLVMVFLCTTGTMMNATQKPVNENVPPRFTFEQCDAYATVVGVLYELSYEEEHNEFVACMEMEQ